MRLWLLPIFVLGLSIKLKSYWNGPLAIYLNSWRGVKVDMSSKCAVVVILCLMLLSLVSLDKVIVLWYISSYILNGAMLYKKLNYQNFTMGKICGTDKYVV